MRSSKRQFPEANVSLHVWPMVFITIILMGPSMEGDLPNFPRLKNRDGF